jgi:quercetin dioxygenase-like cupin family protein
MFKTIAEGVEMQVLRRHDDRGLTFLIQMQHGARAPRHDHPGGEETYLVRGCLKVCARSGGAPDVTLRAGDYLYAPPGEVHEGVAEGETLFFVVTPGGLQAVP